MDATLRDNQFVKADKSAGPFGVLFSLGLLCLMFVVILGIILNFAFSHCRRFK